MKKFNKILLVALTIPLFFSCSNDTLTLDQNSVKVEWTAYKTTDKVPVSGTFNKVEVANLKTGSTPEEVLNGATFSIPVSSLFSDSEERDTKLKQLFFGVMKNTELISGKFIHEDNSSKLSIKMNGVTHEIPVKTSFAGNTFRLNGTLQMPDFDTQEAMDSLNEACYDLHMGADGVSKTWEDVAIEGTFVFNK